MRRNRYKPPTARFNLEPPKNGESLILLKVNYQRGRINYSTGFTIPPTLWDKNLMRAKGKRRGSLRGPSIFEINKELEKIDRIVKEIYIEFDYGKLTRDQYRSEIAYRLGHAKRPKEIGKTLFTFIPSYIEESREKRNISELTWKKYESVLNHLQHYKEDKGEELDFEEINWDFRNAFEQWLYEPPRSFSQNNVAKVFSVLKLFMREAHRRGLHNNVAYLDQGFGVKRVKTKNKVRFTFDELAKIRSYNLSDSPRLERVRDLFVLGAFTGLRFSDWHKIKRENIIQDNGLQFLSIVTQKTKTEVYIFIGEEIREVLERYDYSPPVISHQKFNTYLKEVIHLVLPNATYKMIYSEGGKTHTKTLPKWEKASSHAARRSFATNYYETGEFSAADLMQITGHATERQFFEYIDVTPMQSARRFARITQQRQKKE